MSTDAPLLRRSSYPAVVGRNSVSVEDELKSAAVDGAFRGVRDRQHEAFAIKKNTHWGAIVYVFCQMGSIEAGWQFFDRAAPFFPTGDAAYKGHLGKGHKKNLASLKL